MALIELRDVTKSYRRDAIEVPVLERVSITVPEGDFLGLMGPSGSGKSTLLNLLAGIDRPTRGSVRVGDTEISSLSERALAAWRSRHIGFIFQLYNLIPVLTAFENVELPLVYAGVVAKEREKRAKEALDRVELASRMGHRPNELSGGQRQRVAIARALVNNPSILLADEPTGNLDSKTGLEIMGLFERLHASGNTIVLVTHEADVAAFAHRILHLRDGKIEKDVRQAA